MLPALGQLLRARGAKENIQRDNLKRRNRDIGKGRYRTGTEIRCLSADEQDDGLAGGIFYRR